MWVPAMQLRQTEERGSFGELDIFLSAQIQPHEETKLTLLKIWEQTLERLVREMSETTNKQTNKQTNYGYTVTLLSSSS